MTRPLISMGLMVYAFMHTTLHLDIKIVDLAQQGWDFMDC